jgi:hypothetical protein
MFILVEIYPLNIYQLKEMLKSLVKYYIINCPGGHVLTLGTDGEWFMTVMKWLKESERPSYGSDFYHVIVC